MFLALDWGEGDRGEGEREGWLNVGEDGEFFLRVGPFLGVVDFVGDLVKDLPEFGDFVVVLLGVILVEFGVVLLELGVVLLELGVVLLELGVVLLEFAGLGGFLYVFATCLGAALAGCLSSFHISLSILSLSLSPVFVLLLLISLLSA